MYCISISETLMKTLLGQKCCSCRQKALLEDLNRLEDITNLSNHIAGGALALHFCPWRQLEIGQVRNANDRYLSSNKREGRGGCLGGGEEVHC